MSDYILQYYQQIKDGSVIVGKWIQLWYEYVIRGLDEKRFFYNHKKAKKAIMFIENFCHHHEGKKAPDLIELELWQKAFVSIVFGICDAEGRRQFREIVLIIGRKNGKTLFAGAIAEYMNFCDGEYGSRVYFCATKLDQARLCYDAYYQMLQQEPELASLAKKRRTDIYIESSNSSAQPLTFNSRKADGLNPHLAVCDEIASWRGDAGLKQYEVLKSALGAREQPMILSISTAGYENDSIYDELIKRSTALLNGSSRETRLAPFLYMIDDVNLWNDISELRKSNPNLGVSTTADYLIEEIAIAEQSPSKKTEFITKYCNIKQNSSSAWFTHEEVKKMFTERFSLEDFRGTYALAGIDLSQSVDLTACCCVIEREKKLYVFMKFFLPHEKLIEATHRDGVQYQVYVDRGLLQLSGENVIDYNDCYKWFTDLIEKYEIYPLQVGYDRYSSTYLVQQMEQYGFHMESVHQGFNLTTISDEFEGMLRDGMILCSDDNDLMKIHMLGAAQMIETNTSAHPRKKLVKLSKNTHVDGVAALLDALCMRHNHYLELESQLKNEG